MGLLFSKVTLTAENNGNTAQLLCGGIPLNNYDLEDWLIYQKFMCDNCESQEIKVDVESFVYGKGEIFNANEYEIAVFTGRGEKFFHHPDVHWHSRSAFTVYPPLLRNEVLKC